MAEVLGSVNVVVNAAMEKYERDLGMARRKADEFDRSVSQNMRSVGQATDNLSGIVGKLKLAFIGLIGVASLRELGRMADTWSDINARLRVAVGVDKATQVLNRLDSIARRTYSSLQVTAEGFIFTSRALRELGYSTQQQLDFTEALNNAIVVSGAKSERAAQIQNALSKAIAGGALRGDELNSVLASGGRVAEALAKGLGVTTNQLRGLGAAGKITSDQIVKALTSQLEELRKEADSMPATFQDAFILMGNSVLGFVGRIDTAYNITGSLSVALIGIADTITNATVPALNLIDAGLSVMNGLLNSLGIPIETVVQILGAMGLAGALALALLGVKRLAVAIGTTLIGSFVSLHAVIMANPLLALITAFTVVIAVIYRFREEIKNVIGFDIIKVVKDAGNFIIGAFHFAFDAVVTIWKHLPQVFADLGRGAVAGLVNAFPAAMNAITAGLKAAGLEGFAGGELAYITPPGGTSEAVNTALAGLKQRTMARAGAGALGAGGGIDYLGQLAEIAGASRTTEDATADLNEAIAAAAAGMDPKAAKAAAKLAESYKKIITDGKQFIQQQQLSVTTLAMSAEETNRLQYEMRLLNQATDAGIPLDAAKTAQLKELAAQMASSEAQATKLRTAFDFTKGATRDFLGTLVSGLRSGKSGLDSLIDALGRLTDRLVDLALDLAVNNLFKNLGNLFGVAGGATTGQMAPVTGGMGVSGSWGTIYHGGTDYVGRGGQGQRWMPKAAWDRAPRLHSGEFPAILERGETVLPKNWGRGGQGGMTVKVINQTATPVTGTARPGADGSVEIVLRELKGAMASDIAGGGVLSRQMEATYGLNRAKGL